MSESISKLVSRHQNILRLAGIILASTFLFFGAWTTLKSHDTFSYLAMGKAFFENGSSLFTDHLSITHQGERLKPNPWLYSMVSGGIVSLTGPHGLFALFTALWTAPIIALGFWSCRRNLDSFAVFVAALFLTASFLTRVQLRPELVAYTFLFFSILLAHQYTLDGKRRWLVAMSGIFVLWTQCHSTSSMMLPIFGAAWLHRLVIDLKQTQAGSRQTLAIRQTVWLIGFILLGFVNPNGVHYHPFALAGVHQNEWYGVITEYAGDQRFTTVVQWLNLVGGALLLILLLVQGDLAKVGILVVMLFYAVQIPKLAPHVSIVLTTMGLLFLDGNQNPSRRTPSILTWRKNAPEILRLPRVPYLKLCVLALLLAATCFQLSQQFGPLRQASLFAGAPIVDEDIFAVDIASFIKEKKIAGPTLSELGTASYLEYAVGTPISIYVDQRIGILIPKSIFDVYREAIMRDKALVELTDKHDIKLLVGSNRWPERLIDTALRTRSFSILYIGRSHSLLVPTTSGLGFDQISWLMHDPACLQKIDKAKLIEERMRLDNDSSDSGSALREIADTALALLEKKGVDLATLNGRLSNPHALRLLAYSWRVAGQPEPSLNTQRALNVPAKLVDFLESALALQALGANDIASEALFNSGPDYYYGSRQKAAQFLYVVDGILSKLPKDTPTPPWLEGLRNALKNDPEPSDTNNAQRSCRPTA